MYCSSIEDFRVVGVSGEREEAERECARLQPDIAVVDWLRLADRAEVNLAEAIRRASPATRVVVFARAADPHYVSDAIATGVVGFVLKSSPLDTLARALRTVADGRQFFCPETAGVLRELLRRTLRGNGRERMLSHREMEVLRAIAQGRGSKEIAAGFNLSVYTIENIRRRIMRKTRLKSVAELTLHAVGLGLVEAPGGGIMPDGRGAGAV
jgi:DNA-binding NarL/FixJ family response regulator